ncbi:MAG TPA: hypothetical protein VN577_07555 [Terriglobales bacterium]|nr:hypothetical protein [Terriglobales bacterium]
MAAIVLLPFLSMAMCVPQVNAPMQCPPDCPMMAKINMGHHGMEMKSSKTPGSCCEFRSSTPVPVTEYKTVTPVYSVEPVIASSPVVSTSMIRPVAILEASPPSLPVDSQAQLCTFLI